MDKIEVMIRNGLQTVIQNDDLDIEALINTTHGRIKRRAMWRKTLYASPVAVLLVLMVLAVWPQRSNDAVLPGGELFLAGWSDPWTSEPVTAEDTIGAEDLYEQSVDYLIDDQYDAYSETVQELMDEQDLTQFSGFLKEV